MSRGDWFAVAKVRYGQKIDYPEPGNRVLHFLRQVRNRHFTNTPQPTISSRSAVLTNLRLCGIEASMKRDDYQLAKVVILLILLSFGLAMLVIVKVGQ